MDFSQLTAEEIVYKAKNKGCLSCNYLILLENNKDQVLNIVSKLNPLFYNTFGEEIDELKDDNEQLAQYLAVRTKGGDMFFYIPSDEEFMAGETQTERGAQIKAILQNQLDF